jgi:hypothetical protein
MTNPPTPQGVTLREALEPFAKLFQSLQSKHDGPMPTTFEAIISTADVQRAAYAFADLSHPPAPEQASVEHPVTLTDVLQKRCYEWGTYWRSSDAHGVKLNTEQALELLRDALGVEVEIAATPTAEPVGEPDPQLCKFYQVKTYPELVAAQAHHIEKLQAKLPPLRNEQPGKVREG